MILDGKQLRFLYDVGRNLVPHLDMIPSYFPSLDAFTEMVQMGYVEIHPLRQPGEGEQRLLQVEGIVYYGIYASVFRPELTPAGKALLDELSTSELFSACMIEMDEEIARHILGKERMV
jgi:hypothetical protein